MCIWCIDNTKKKKKRKAEIISYCKIILPTEKFNRGLHESYKFINTIFKLTTYVYT